MKETTLLRKILLEIKRLRGDGYHVHGSALQRKGEPDIDGYIIYKGERIHLKLEVKLPGKKPTPLQIYRLREYAHAGYLVWVITSPDQLLPLAEAWVTMKRTGGTLPNKAKIRGLLDEYNLYS